MRACVRVCVCVCVSALLRSTSTFKRGSGGDCEIVDARFALFGGRRGCSLFFLLCFKAGGKNSVKPSHSFHWLSLPSLKRIRRGDVAGRKSRTTRVYMLRVLDDPPLTSPHPPHQPSHQPGLGVMCRRPGVLLLHRCAPLAELPLLWLHCKKMSIPARLCALALTFKVTTEACALLSGLSAMFEPFRWVSVTLLGISMLYIIT